MTHQAGMYPAKIRTNIFLFIAILATPFLAISQNEKKEAKEKKGTFYFSLGSHFAFYSKSDIHVHRGGGSPFDFTLYDVKSKDDGGLKFETAPQYTFNFGYYFTKKKFGIEFQYDHIKYFVRQNQRVHLKGVIEGVGYDKDTTLIPAFFQMEHSNGGNYAMFNFVKWFSLTKDLKSKFKITLLAKGGFGIVYPKTNTTIMGHHRDDQYHISGYVAGLESGLRFNYGKYLFATTTFKGAFANYSDFLIAFGSGDHHFFSAQLIYLVGAQFPL